jgi:sarcosine oxidase subunit gamma
MGSTSTDATGVQVTVRDDLGHINLRGDAADKTFNDAIEAAAGQPLPVAPNTTSSGDHQIFWLGPDEWLILTESTGAPSLSDTIQQATGGLHASVNDVSGGQVALQLQGAKVRTLLAKGCTLDLHPSVFAAGFCAQSGLAKANVLLGLVDDAPTFIVVVRRSFADYLCRWFSHAGRDIGIAFIAA